MSVTCFRCGLPTDEPKVQPIDGEQEFLCPECALLCAACEGSGRIGEERCKHCFGTGIGTSDDDRDYFGW